MTKAWLSPLPLRRKLAEQVPGLPAMHHPHPRWPHASLVDSFSLSACSKFHSVSWQHKRGSTARICLDSDTSGKEHDGVSCQALFEEAASRPGLDLFGETLGDRFPGCFLGCCCTAAAAQGDDRGHGASKCRVRSSTDGACWRHPEPEASCNAPHQSCRVIFSSGCHEGLRKRI